MTKDEALKLALDFIEGSEGGTTDLEAHIKEALAQPAQQEPVAWEQFYPDMGKPKLAYLPTTELPDNACYTPPQRPWVGLTDEDWEQIHDRKGTSLDTFDQGAAWAANRLKERNT